MTAKRTRIIRRIRETFQRRYPDISPDDPKQCLRWANATCIALKRHGIVALPVGGSMNWPIVPPHLDDGVSATHFSYEFEPQTPQSQLAMISGNLPEMHVWAYLPATDEIIDMTTRHLKAQCARLAPTTQWRAANPPDHLWVSADNLPAGVFYTPDIDATELVHRILIRLSRNAHIGLDGSPVDPTTTHEAPEAP